MLRKLQNQIHDYLQQENTQTKEQSEEGFTISYTEANKVARKQNLEMDAQYSINQSRIIYQQERNKTAKLTIYWLYWVYAILAIIFTYFLLRGPKSATITWKFKLLYIALIIAFPFVIVPIELTLKKIVLLFYHTILAKPYEESKWQVIGETEFQKKYGIDSTMENEERMKGDVL